MTTSHCNRWPEGPAAPPVLDDIIHIWRIPLDVDPGIVAGLRQLLSADEKQRADRYHFEKHRRRFVVCRGGQRLILSRYLGRRPHDLRFDYGQRGKPSIDMPLENHCVAFNVSNSQELALCAIAPGFEIGIDVEETRDVRDLIGLATRFFAESEIEHLNQLRGKQRLQAFFAIWTRKEAVLKAVGTGLAFPLDKVVVTPTPAGECRVLQFGDTPDGAESWWLQSLDPAPGYIGAIAAESKERPYVCWTLDLSEVP